MFDLNKIIDIIKGSDREVFLAKENEDLVVIMSVNRYRELSKISSEAERIRKNNPVNNDSFVNSIKEVKEENYPDYVKKTIMPEIDTNV